MFFNKIKITFAFIILFSIQAMSHMDSAFPFPGFDKKFQENKPEQVLLTQRYFTSSPFHVIDPAELQYCNILFHFHKAMENDGYSSWISFKQFYSTLTIARLSILVKFKAETVKQLRI